MTAHIKTGGEKNACEYEDNGFHDLGTYSAKSGRLKANLNLYSRPGSIATIYIAKVIFETPPQWQGDKVGFSLKADYSNTTLEDLFAKMKKAEEGFEVILEVPTDTNSDWQSKRDVMRCILSLEDKVDRKHHFKEKE